MDRLTWSCNGRLVILTHKTLGYPPQTETPLSEHFVDGFPTLFPPQHLFSREKAQLARGQHPPLTIVASLPLPPVTIVASLPLPPVTIVARASLPLPPVTRTYQRLQCTRYKPFSLVTVSTQPVAVKMVAQTAPRGVPRSPRVLHAASLPSPPRRERVLVQPGGDARWLCSKARRRCYIDKHGVFVREVSTPTLKVE
eukprot:scaffold17589_cov52-Phaeocystis_antarctica.AAC.2